MSDRPARPTSGGGDGVGRAVATLAVTTVAALLVGGAYLFIVPTRYTAVSKLVVERATPATTRAESADGPDEFLAAQADVLRSTEVLRLADARAGLGSLPSFASVRDPLPPIRRDLRVAVAGNGGVLTVSYPSTNQDDAARVVDAIVRAYVSYQSDKRQQRAAELVESASTARQPLAEQADRVARSLAAAESSLAARGNADALAQRVRTQAEVLAQLQLAAVDARRAYDDAVAAAGPLLSKLTDEELDRTVRAADAGPLEPADKLGEQIDASVRRLGEMKRTYADNHPAVVRLRGQIDRMRVERVASARQRWQALASREAELKSAADRAQADAAAVATLTADRDRLRDEARRLAARLDEADRQMDAARAVTAGTLLNVEVITRADADDPRFPPLPRPAPTLTLALLAGLTLGGLVATLGEYRRAGTLRHVAPRRGSDRSAEATLAREAFGLRVLASIPDSPVIGEQANDQAAKLRLEPAPPVMRAAAAARERMAAEGFERGVLAVTSSREGEGRSIVALGLATSLARSGAEVLLVDANVDRADAGGREGLLDVLADGRLDDRTAGSTVENLQTLDVGRGRADAADLLNSPALAEAFAAMAGRFEHVIVDCPALSSGDAARVLAANADAALLVSDGSVTALRRAATGRDVLQLVGARVLGAVLNRTRYATESNGNQRDGEPR